MSKIQEIADYRANPALNYSLLKKVLANDTKEFKGSLAATLGSLLDCMITMGEEFDKLYHVEDFERVENLLTESIEYVYEQKKEWDLEYIYNVAKKKGYGGRTYTEERIKEKIEELKWHYDLLVLKETKEIISVAEYNQACYEYKLLTENSPFKEILKNGIFQLPLYGELEVDSEMVPVKSLPDIVEIQDMGSLGKKIIYTDLKRTAFGLSNWPRAVREKGYLLQASLTQHLLAQTYNVPIDNVSCQWLVVSNNKAAIISISPEDLLIGMEGAKKIKSVTYCEGVEIVETEVIYGIKDAVKIFLQSIHLKLSDWDIKSYVYQGIYPKRSVYS
jgi:hypothetical protein